MRIQMMTLYTRGAEKIKTAYSIEFKLSKNNENNDTNDFGLWMNVYLLQGIVFVVFHFSICFKMSTLPAGKLQQFKKGT